MLETFLLNLSIKSPAACICGQPDWAKGMILLSAAWASGLSRRTAEMPGAEALDRPGGSRGGGGVVRTARIAPRRSLLSFPHLYRANRHSGKRAAGGLAADAPPTGMAGPEDSSSGAAFRCASRTAAAFGGRLRVLSARAFYAGKSNGRSGGLYGTVSASRAAEAVRFRRGCAPAACGYPTFREKRAAQRLCTYRFAAESDGRPFSRAPPIRGAASVRCGQPFFAA